MKTHNLTQINLRNDPINRRMQGFSFRISEDEVWSSRWQFSFLFRLNYGFIHSIEAEMSCEHIETNGTWNGWVHKMNLKKLHERLLPSRRTIFKRTKLMCNRPMKRRFDQRLWWDVSPSNHHDQIWSVRSTMKGRDDSTCFQGKRCVDWSSVRFKSCDRDWSEARWISTVIMIAIDGEDDCT